MIVSLGFSNDVYFYIISGWKWCNEDMKLALLVWLCYSLRVKLWMDKTGLCWYKNFDNLSRDLLKENSK